MSLFGPSKAQRQVLQQVQDNPGGELGRDFDGSWTMGLETMGYVQSHEASDVRTKRQIRVVYITQKGEELLL